MSKIYQINELVAAPFDTIEKNQENFQKLMDAFEAEFKTDSFQEFPEEIKLNNQVQVNFACIWNLPGTIGKKVLIKERNEKMALVMFNTSDFEPGEARPELMNCIFRLEDLDIEFSKD